MRLLDIIETKIDEVSMSPGALADFAKTNIAQSMTAGFEAELVIPDAQGDDENEQEPDYDEDQRIYSTTDISDFFVGEYNSRREVERVIEKIEEEMLEYIDDELRGNFEEEAVQVVKDAMKDADVDEDDITQAIEDKNDLWDEYYNEAYNEWRDEQDLDYLTERFLRRNYPRMTDVENEFQLVWPFWKSGMGEGRSIDEIADEISSSIGMEVKGSHGYHSKKRGTDYFILEPDSSIDAGSGSAGLELVSPPMPLTTCLEYLDKVFEWAQLENCQTNKSTGFHMGISIPNQTMQNVDHLKFTLFLGDEYVLKQFGREANTYAKSMMKEMANSLKQGGSNIPLTFRSATVGNPRATADIEKILNTFKAGLNSEASAALRSSITRTGDRYVTVNIKENYIEVRSAGGNYINDLNKIKNTLLRYVRAMALAADPEAEKQEYAKKLYKFLSPMIQGQDDIIKYFSQYSSGTLPAAALKSFVKNIQTQRDISRDKPIKGEIGSGPNLYKVDFFALNGPDHVQSIVVRGTTRRNITDTFRQVYPQNLVGIHAIEDLKITVRPKSYRMTDQYGGYLGTITAMDNEEAIHFATLKAQLSGLRSGQWKLMDQEFQNIPLGNEEPESTPQSTPQATAPSTGGGTYIVRYQDPQGDEYTTAYDAASRMHAIALFQEQHPATYRVVSVVELEI